MRKIVTWGLFLAWLANDADEWFTVARWSKRNVANGRGPLLLGPSWMCREISPAHARTAISLMGLIMLAATISGARTGGRSALFQSALVGFGAHGLAHLITRRNSDPASHVSDIGPR